MTWGPTSAKLAAGAALVIVAMTGGLGSAQTAGAASSPPDPLATDSALTLTGKGRFADLSVSVGKTQHLSSEAVSVRWQWGGTDPGSHATSPDDWSYNYLTIFQCWGDDKSAGPSREQCQYGGLYGYGADIKGSLDNAAPFSNSVESRYAVSRTVSLESLNGGAFTQFGPTKDPLEFSDPAGYPSTDGVSPSSARSGVVPLWSAPSGSNPAGTKTIPDNHYPFTSSQFDQWQTNEIAVARTAADGTGTAYFQAQRATESQFLGCGAKTGTDAAGAPIGRACWLVVVPRDAIEVTGVDVRNAVNAGDRSLRSSALSLSNWANRIVFPMQFDPIHEPCRLGGAERPIYGHESLANAMTSWQGPLCEAGQGYFYATMTDDLARADGLSASPALAVITEPVQPGALAADQGSLVYAPVAISGVSISVFIERVYNSSSSPIGLRPYRGSRVEQLRLTPRLVAKLLTQSYQFSTVVNPVPDHLKDKPATLLVDPEFRRVNQGFLDDADVTQLSNAGNEYSFAQLYVPLSSSDAVQLLWRWILADPRARDFLGGKADDFGMTINKYYQGLDIYETKGVPRSDIPRLDPTCNKVPKGADAFTLVDWCALDSVPYAPSLEAAGINTSAGVPPMSGRDLDTVLNTMKAVKAPPQLAGQRAVLALTDTPTAMRRGLVSAALPNSDGQFVVPTADTMGAAVGQSVDTSIVGVRRVDPSRVGKAGYPLTRLEYAVTNPALLDAGARTAYANFVTTATTDGQRVGSKPGMLPPGYAPLPGSYQAQAVLAARVIRTATAPVSASTPGPTAEPTPVEATGGSLFGGGSAPSATAAPVPAATPEIAPVSTATASTSAPTDTGLLATIQAALTPSGLSGTKLVPGVAAVGLVSAFMSQALLRRRRGPSTPEASASGGSTPLPSRETRERL
jgi:hypothetical protein